MNILALSLIALIALILAILPNNSNSGLPQTGGKSDPVIFNYSRNHRELENVDNVLDRQVTKGTTIVNPVPCGNTNADYVIRNEIKPLNKSISQDLKALIQYRQPYMFDKPKITDIDTNKYYYDWKYPRKPISVEFLKNPKKYCRSNPLEYPCTDSRFQSSLNYAGPC